MPIPVLGSGTFVPIHFILPCIQFLKLIVYIVKEVETTCYFGKLLIFEFTKNCRA